MNDGLRKATVYLCTVFGRAKNWEEKKKRRRESADARNDRVKSGFVFAYVCKDGHRYILYQCNTINVDPNLC